MGKFREVRVRFTDEQYARVEEEAASIGAPVAVFARFTVLQSLKKSKPMTLAERKAVEKTEAEAKRAENMRQHYAARDALTPRQRAEYDHLVGEHDEDWLHNYRNSLIAHVTNNF